MDVPDSDESPLERAAGGAGPHTIDAFKQVGNETRLAILLALWEAYDPHTQENELTFSELRNQIGVQQGSQFNYHLNKLVDRFVEKTDQGYEIRNPGLKIVKAVIAGSGFDDQTLSPTEIPVKCHICGASVELSYRDEHLYHTCTECKGMVPPNLRDELPSGTLMRTDFSPAALTNRTAEEVFVAGTIDRFEKFGLIVRGNCPECAGRMDEEIRICDDHDYSNTSICEMCGTMDEVRVRYVCSVCKWWGFLPVEATVQDHPAVVSFCYEHGIEGTYEIDSPESCARFWKHIREREHTVVTEDPLRIQVTVPSSEKSLQLTLDDELSVTNVIESVV